MPDQDSNGMSTETLLRRLDQLGENMTRHAVERHQLNDKLSSIVSSLTVEVKRNNDKVDALSATMAKVGDELKDLKVRVAGNPELSSMGLIQELAQFRKAIEMRIEAIEHENASFRTKLNYVIGGFLTITGLGTVLAWTQAQFQWPFGGGGKP